MLCSCDPILESGNSLLKEFPSVRRLNQQPIMTPAAKRVLNVLSRRMGSPVEIYQFKNGTIFCGTWKERRLEGFGCAYLRGCYIQGQWLNGKIKGYALMIQDNGAYFQGKIENGMAVGKGIYVSQFYKYEGMFRMNQRHGQGVETTPYYRFEGIFAGGSRRSGRMEWEIEGKMCSYEGGFMNNYYHGNGVLRCPDGVFQGLFVKGKLVERSTKFPGEMISI